MSDLWTTASTDATAANRQRVFAGLRIEAAQYWGLLSDSENEVDFGNRLALVAPQLDAIVSRHVKDAAEYITYRGELETALTQDFAIINEARQKTAYPQGTVRCGACDGTGKGKRTPNKSRPGQPPKPVTQAKCTGCGGKGYYKLSAKVAGMDPIGYTYEADVHCPSCAEKRFGRGADGFIGSDSTDSEGNPVGVISPWDEGTPFGEYCGDCGVEITPPNGLDTEGSRTAAFDDDECYGCGYKGEDGWTRDYAGEKCPKCGSYEIHGPDAGANWGKKDAKTAADYQGDRAARVNGNASLDQVQAYMPSNYTASQDADGTIWISGHDSAGWTLDGYVIPRLASGLISATEVEGSGPNDPANANATFASKTADADFNWGKAAQEILDQLVERGVSKEWLWEDGNWDAPTFVTVHGGTVKDIDSGKASVVDGKIRYNLTSSAFKTSSADLTNDDLQELADKGNELAAAMLRVRQDSGRGDDGSTPRPGSREWSQAQSARKQAWTADESDVTPIARQIMDAYPDDRSVSPELIAQVTGPDVACLTDYNFHTEVAAILAARPELTSFSSKKTATYVPCTNCFKPSLQVNASKALCRECQG